MVEIVVIGAVAAVTGGARLAQLDGVQASESLLEHLDGPLDDLDLDGGHLRLVWRAKQKRLEVETTWLAPRALSAKERAALVDYTVGQWSDGVGENFTGELADERGIELELSPDLDQVRVEMRERRSAKPARRSNAGGKALLKAAAAGDVATIARLLDAGAPIDARNKWQQTPLMVAIFAEHTQASELLLARGADIEAVAATGCRPLHAAAMMGLAPVVSALLARGARSDVRSEDPAGDGPGMTPREWAVSRNHPAVVRLLDRKR